MITLKSCPNCKSSNIAFFRIISGGVLAIEIMKGVKVNAEIVVSYCTCQDCRLIFQNPRLSDTELKKYYSTGYYRRTVNMTDEQIDVNAMGRAKKDAKIIKHYAGKVTSHLDIGCGRGYLLDAIGASVKAGVELDVGYVKMKDITVYPEINLVSKKSFDLVTAMHVLEHVPSPLDYLKSMTKFISKTGYIVVEVPTWKSPGGPLRLAHLYHFEPQVLKNLCKKADLSVVYEEFTPHFLLICRNDYF